MALALGLEEAAEAGVADQRLVTPGQLPLEVGQNGLARGGIPLGLLMVAAEDVASVAHGHRLGFVVDLVTAGGLVAPHAVLVAQGSGDLRGQRVVKSID